MKSRPTIWEMERRQANIQHLRNILSGMGEETRQQKEEREARIENRREELLSQAQERSA